LRLIRITDRTLSCLDGLPHDRGELLRFLALLIQTNPGAVEMSERMFRLLSPLPEYSSYVLRIERVCDVANYPDITEFVCNDVSAGMDDRVRAEVLLNNVNDIGIVDDYVNCAKVRILGMDDTLCGDYQQTFVRLKEIFRGDVEFCPTDRFHCATALAAEWVTSGGGGEIVTSFCGIGGVAPTEEVIMALRMNGLRGADKVYDFFPEMSKMFAKIAKKNVPPNKPIIGKRIFHVESSVHVDGILKQPECYEPFPPETVGQARKIILGKQSGIASIRAKLSEFDINHAEEYIPRILETVRAKGIDKGGAVTDREFIKITNDILDKNECAIYDIHNITQVATEYETNSIYNVKQVTTGNKTNLVHNFNQVATESQTNPIHNVKQAATEFLNNNAKPRRYIVDSTLRDGEQTPGICFSAEQKLKIAALLDSCGVHQIEAGVPAASRREKDSIVKIIENRKNAVISVWARLVPSDIEHAVDVQPDIIHVCVPVSRTHIYQKLRRDEDWVINQLRDCLRLIEKNNITVSVGFEDAFRADVGFMLSVAKILLGSGVTRIRLSDTVGAASPALCRAVLNELSSALDGGAAFGIHAHNDLGMAVANTVEAAKAGCLYADVTANGIGERAGNCDFARLVHASASIFDWGMTAAAAREAQREIGDYSHSTRPC
jgi:homocitrate synthase NifV